MIIFVLNDRWRIKKGSATLRLIWECTQRGQDVGLTDVFNFSISSERDIFANVLKLDADKFDSISEKKLYNRISKIKPSSCRLEVDDTIWVRTSPGRDLTHVWAHQTTLNILTVAHRNGIKVLNKPTGLQKASSKFYTVTLPSQTVPKTHICHSISDVKRAATDFAGPFIIKPLMGSQGRDVFFIENTDALNINQIADILGRTGFMVLQEFLPEAAEGDIRVLTLGSKLLGRTNDDQVFGIKRTPRPGEFRSNVALGAVVSVTPLSKKQEKICLKVAKQLEKDGLPLTGIELIGDKVVEVNVFSPGGYQDLSDLTGLDLVKDIMELIGI